MAIRHVALPHTLTFKQKTEVAPGVFAFSFIPQKPITWRAGQHGIFEIPLANGKTGRKPFSISSAPAEGVVTITTRVSNEFAGPFKQALFKMKKGTEIKMRGPIGKLYIKHPKKSYGLLATGIGITPFRSLLTQLDADQLDTKVTLVYVGNKDNHFYRSELTDIKNKYPNITIYYIFKPERITGHIIEEIFASELPDTIFLLSGSRQMIKSYRRTLQGLGVPRSHIKKDTFLGLRPASAPPTEP
jgi:ferredoxin-NADP reductase